MLGFEFKIQTSNGNHKGKLKGDKKDLWRIMYNI